MAQPPLYERAFDFSDWEATHPSEPKPGVQFDIEFDRLVTSVAAIIANLGVIQRDDGALRNASVGALQLDPEILSLLGGWSPKGTWSTATIYSVKDVVRGPDGLTYVALTAHTSGVFATDVSAGRWMALNRIYNVKVTGADSAAGFLNDKISVTGLIKSVTSPGGNEVLNIAAPESNALATVGGDLSLFLL